MKHIGIVAVTTVGACICANEIVAEAARRYITGKHPEITVHTFSFDKYKKLIVEKKWGELSQLIIESICKLQKIGADFIIIPSNTPHYGFVEIAKKSPLPVLNLVELTANECQQRGFKKVAILGTKSTMQEGLYERPLKQRGITSIIPDEKGCEAMNSLIMDEIIPAKASRFAAAETVAKTVIRLLQCDAVILGCTELPEVYNAENIGMPVIDTTRLLAHQALDHAFNSIS
jgi:aspartate racemase